RQKATCSAPTVLSPTHLRRTYVRSSPGGGRIKDSTPIQSGHSGTAVTPSRERASAVPPKSRAPTTSSDRKVTPRSKTPRTPREDRGNVSPTMRGRTLRGYLLLGNC